MKYARFKSFGWVIYRVSVSAGESFVYEVKSEALPNRLSAQTIYTKGLCTGHYEGDVGRAAMDRVPGFANDSLPSPLPCLRLNMTAQEDSEWWCLSKPFNATIPAVEFVRLQPGESMPINTGDLVFVCEGDMLIGNTASSGPKSIRGIHPGVLTAGSTAVYGMKFNQEAPK
jgi:hypothetical protein